MDSTIGREIGRESKKVTCTRPAHRPDHLTPANGSAKYGAKQKAEAIASTDNSPK